MANSNNIVVNVDFLVSAAQARDVTSVMVLDTNHTTFARSYLTTKDEFVGQTETDSNIRKMLASCFSPTPTPPFITVGRSKGKTTFSFNDVAVSEQYSFSIQVGNSEGATVTADYTAIVADTAEEVAIALKADIDAVTAITDVVSATVLGVGEDAVLEVALTDISSDYIFNLLTANIGVSYLTTEAPTEAINAVIASGRSFGYILSTEHNTSYQVALMEAAEVFKRLYVTSVDSAAAYLTPYDGETAPASDNVAHLAAHRNYNYTHVHYHNRSSDYPEGARLLEFSTIIPGQSDFQYKSIAGFGVAQKADGTGALGTTELANLESANVSTIINEFGNSVVGGFNGQGNRVASGTRIEVIVGANYAKSLVEAGLATLRLRSRKLGMDDRDIDRINAVIADRLRPLVTTPTQVGLLRERAGQFVPFIIEFPKASEINVSDQQAGNLVARKIDLFINPSIDRIQTTITLTFAGI